MSELYILVEGRGEKAFVERVLAVHLASVAVWAYAPLVGKPGHKGGVRPWKPVEKELCAFLKINRPGRIVHVSMMFDYFRMPTSWPGREAAGTKRLSDRARTVEEGLMGAVCEAMGEGFNPSRFIPYVQIHELEALILADPARLIEEFPEQADEIRALTDEIGAQAAEDINDNPGTSPSARIISRIPQYEGRKASAAANVLEAIGLPTLCQRCPHFGEWVRRLESLGSASEG